MATALSLNPLLRHSVGFDRFNDLFDNVADNSRNAFPPYDIIKCAENSYKIVMAVAGYDEKDIHIVLENGTLKVSGKLEAENKTDVEYLHRGIAKRAFEQSYRLADHMKVKKAQMLNGILSVHLEREIPEAQKPQLIAINQ